MPRLVVPMRVPELEDSRSASSSWCSERISVVFSAMRRLSGVIAMPCPARRAISSISARGSITTPLPITDSLSLRTTPEGSNESLKVIPSMTSVCPALWPPWKRTTTSACSDNQSTILPLPSSPHWAPTTTTFATDHPPNAKIPAQGRDFCQKPCGLSSAIRPARSRLRPAAPSALLAELGRDVLDHAPRLPVRRGELVARDAPALHPIFDGLTLGQVQPVLVDEAALVL